MNTFDRHIHEALIYVEQNLSSGTPLEDTAAHVYLSPSHFSRLLKNVTGTSYSDYLTNQRLIRAQTLLESGKYSVSGAADDVGIANPSYLCVLFKKNLGITPSEVKKQL